MNLFSAFFRRSDPAWRSGSIIQKFTGHDESKARSIFVKEQRIAAKRRARSQAVIQDQQQARQEMKPAIPFQRRQA